MTKIGIDDWRIRMSNKLQVKFKKLSPDVKEPFNATEGSAGWDLYANSKKELDNKIIYGTGLAFEIPAGHVGLIFPRSSIHKYDLSLSNCVGVIDSDYSGEVSFVFNSTGHKRHDIKTSWGLYETYKIGERIGQMIIMPYPSVEYIEVEELSKTERGSGGFGSTGK